MANLPEIPIRPASPDERTAALLKDLESLDDIEYVHQAADKVLLSLLGELGCHKTVEAFRALPKWYA